MMASTKFKTQMRRQSNTKNYKEYDSDDNLDDDYTTDEEFDQYASTEEKAPIELDNDDAIDDDEGDCYIKTKFDFEFVAVDENWVNDNSNDDYVPSSDESTDDEAAMIDCVDEDAESYCEESTDEDDCNE